MTGHAAARSYSSTISFAITAAVSPDETVNGTLDRTVDLRSDGFVGSGALMDFAEFLTMTACKRAFGGKQVGGLLQSSINNLCPTPARVLTGECRLSTLKPGIAMSETEIWDDEIGRVAVVTQMMSVVDRDAAAIEESESLGNGTVLALTPNKADGATDIPAIRRQQIFEAALNVITEKGFERATIREISREAGLTIPTMYQYFRRKDDILALIFDTYLQKMETELNAAIAAEGSARDRLVAAIKVTLASLNRHYREIRVMAQDTKSLRPDVKRAVINKMLNYLGAFTKIVSDGVKSGEFRPVDAELYANLIPMMCQVWTQRHWSVGKFGLDAVEKAVLDMALNGLKN
jgi:AcrR family transcriptional regulator